jgi:HlyD family type I secretion membrane fusion protein
MLKRADDASAAEHRGKRSADAEPPSLSVAIRSPFLLSQFVVLMFFGVFGTWASVAPLAGAAVAPGVFNPDSNKKSIQHLEGGIIKEILVTEGTRVEKDQLLVVLDEEQIDKELQKQILQQHLLTAKYARLELEQRAATQRSFPERLEMPASLIEVAKRLPKAAATVAMEQQLYASRTATLLSKVASYEQTISQQEDEIKTLRERQRTLSELVDIIAKEVEVGGDLLKKSLKKASEVYNLQKDGLSKKEEMFSVAEQADKMVHSIKSARLQIADLWVTRLQEVNDDLAKTAADLNAIEEDIRGLTDKLRRTKVRSPVAGTVVGLKIFTVGGVVAAGAVLLDIIPKEDRLIVDAKVDPNDVEGIHAGLLAQATLLAYSAREVPMAQGKVLSISADTLTDADNKKYYLAKVEIDGKALGKTGSGKDIRIAPGMNVEVMIMTEPRTLLSYLLDPLIRSVRRSMVER